MCGLNVIHAVLINSFAYDVLVHTNYSVLSQLMISCDTRCCLVSMWLTSTQLPCALVLYASSSREHVEREPGRRLRYGRIVRLQRSVREDVDGVERRGDDRG
jgi:hypothetical protein